MKTAALLLLTALVYVGSLNAPYVYDDIGAIRDNAGLDDKGLARAALTGQTLTDPDVLDGRRPAALLTFRLERQLWNSSPVPGRIINLLLHLLNVWLLLKLLSPMAGRRAAWFAAVLAALHPVAVETVHMVSFREDLLVLTGALICLHGAVRLNQGTRHRCVAWLGLMLFGAVLAAFSKESGLAVWLLPLLLWLAMPRLRPRRVWVLGWFVLLSLVLALWLPLLLRQPMQAAGGVWNGRSFQWPATLLTAPWMALFALRLLMVPAGYSIDYTVLPVETPVSWRLAAGVLFAVLFAGLLMRCRKGGERRRIMLFWLCWAVLFFVPVSNLWPLYNPAANRYVYVLLPAFAVAAGLLFSALRQQLSGSVNRWTPAVAAVILAVLTGWELAGWQSGRIRWERTLRQNPQSDRAMVWLGLYAREAGDLERAAAWYERALQANPQAVRARINLGVVHGMSGRLAIAEQHFRQALMIDPLNRDAWKNLALVYRKTGRVRALKAARRRIQDLSAK